MTMRDRFLKINGRIESICESTGRDRGSIRLIAVSKTHPASAIRQAYATGQREFGENYADELEAKALELGDLRDIKLIFIGPLQSNKIQKIIRHASEIQTIASEKHARYADRYAAEFNKSGFPVWIEVNAGDESTKHGTSLTDAASLAAFIQTSCPRLTLQGLMCIPPATIQDSWLSEHPGMLPDLYKNLKQASLTIGAGKLSLGMSGDMELAIRAGTDVIRVGRALFSSSK